MLFWVVFPKDALKCLGRNLGMMDDDDDDDEEEEEEEEKGVEC